MVDVKELYPSEEDRSFFCIGNYQPMVEAFGKVVVQVDESDYQGSTWVWYEKDGRYGYLVFGWGSCSGCDSLQACSTMADVQELADGLEQGIEWFESKDAARRWFEEKDWEGEWHWHQDEFHDFLGQLSGQLGLPPWSVPAER